jgi:uncharacterized protein YgiM (DUF1202 family)
MEEIIMSKKHHNYTNYSKPQEAPVVGIDLAQGADFSTPVVEPEVVESVVEEESVTESDEVIGVVTDCVKLNVRKEPSKDSDVVCELLLGTEVMIDIFESTDDFYKVITEAGVEGYCMKKFINADL